jgi:hypothetical protein
MCPSSTAALSPPIRKPNAASLDVFEIVIDGAASVRLFQAASIA